jgi:alpha-L-fucosidase 2
MAWKDKKITSVEIISKAGKPCRINAGNGYKVTQDGKEIASKTKDDGSIEFDTIEGSTYLLSTL